MIPQSVQVLQHGFQEDPLYQQLVRPDELLFLDVPSCQVLYCERRPIQAVAPGQAAVFYRDDEVLGGGTITATESS